MKLDRNTNKQRIGKYALIKLRVDLPHEMAMFKHDYAISKDAVDFGDTRDTEFFVIRLKDKYAASALRAYANQANQDDPEYAKDVHQLADIAESHPRKRRPD